VYHVSIIRIARLVGTAPDDDDDAMADVVADTGDLVDEAFATVTDVPEAEAAGD